MVPHYLSMADLSLGTGRGERPSPALLERRMPACWCPLCHARRVYAVMRYDTTLNDPDWVRMAIYRCTRCYSLWTSMSGSTYGSTMEGDYLRLDCCLHMELSSKEFCETPGCPAYLKETWRCTVPAGKYRVWRGPLTPCPGHPTASVHETEAAPGRGAQDRGPETA